MDDDHFLGLRGGFFVELATVLLDRSTTRDRNNARNCWSDVEVVPPDRTNPEVEMEGREGPNTEFEGGHVVGGRGRDRRRNAVAGREVEDRKILLMLNNMILLQLQFLQEEQLQLV